MLKPIVAFAVVLSCGAIARADYPADRKAAMKLVWSGRHEEALAAFLKMVETAASDVQKSDALDLAAMCAHRLKRNDQAMKLAQRIPLAPASKTCQMRVLTQNRKWREVADTFKDEDLDAWPEYLAAEAFYMRGQAHYQTKDGQKAAADLAKAAEYLTDGNILGLALNRLGDTYRDLLKDDARAIAAYRRAYQTYNVYKHCPAAMAIAGILSRQQKHDDALQELRKIDMSKVTIPYWRGAMLAAYARVLAKQGNKAEALAKYNEALQVQGIYPVQKTAFEKALQELQAEAK